MKRLSIANRQKYTPLLSLQQSEFCKAAVTRLWTPDAECLPQYCQKWIRELVQSQFGNLYDEYWKSSAKLTAQALATSPYNVPKKNGSLPGDILYQVVGHGEYGHVGVRVWSGWVAQNSSRFWNGIDARGANELREFGPYDYIIRFPGAYLDSERPKDRELTREELADARRHLQAAIQKKLF